MLPLATSQLGSENRFESPLENPKRRTISSLYVEEGGSRNSSVGGVWAEDYYGRDSLPSPPSPVAYLERKNSEPTYEEENVGRKTRANSRSLTSLLPSLRPVLSRAKSKSPERRSRSPEKVVQKERTREEEDAFMPTFTGDKPGTIRVQDRSRGGLAGWFNGTSEPVPLGIPIEQDTSSDTYSDESTERPSARLRKMQTDMSVESTSSSSTPTPQKAASRGAFSFFSALKSPSKPDNTVQIPAALDTDELLTLSIQDSLFPSGQSEPFSPSAYKNLQQNATGLSTKLQTAYKNRTLAYHDLLSETSVKSEELEEAEMCAHSLRSQLDNLSSEVSSLTTKFSTQEAVIEDLITQLAHEKMLRAEEAEAREKSIQLLKAAAAQHPSTSTLTSNARKHASSSSLSLDEELGIPTASSRHHSYHDSLESVSGESDAESVFSSFHSRPMSPQTAESTPEVAQAAFGRVVPRPRPQTVSSFKRIHAGLTNSVTGGVGSVEGREGCERCNGNGESSRMAWDTVAVLREENKGLKQRVESLEEVVEGAVEMCGWRRV